MLECSNEKLELQNRFNKKLIAFIIMDIRISENSCNRQRF